MPILNRKIDYALLILCYLHQQSEGGCARAIAGRYGISRAFVANILKILCQRGFVFSQRGVKGGYTLCEQTTHKSLADLLDALDDSVQLAECTAPAAPNCCPLEEECPIQGPIGEIHQRIRYVLESVNLRDLFERSKPLSQPLQMLGLSRCEGVQKTDERLEQKVAR